MEYKRPAVSLVRFSPNLQSLYVVPSFRLRQLLKFRWICSRGYGVMGPLSWQSTETILMPLDRGRFLVVHPCSTWLMARWKASVEFFLSVTELLFLSLTVEALQGKMCQNSLPSGGGRSLGAKISGQKGRPPANILIPLERQLIVLQLCRWQFLYNETLQQTFRHVLSKLSKRWQI